MKSSDSCIKVLFDNKAVYAKHGSLLSEAISGEKPCGGHGKCGKCKVKVIGEVSPLSKAEKNHLTETEISQGVRLACLTKILGECRVERITTVASVNVLTEASGRDINIAPTFNDLGVAVDIGTTTVAARLYNTRGQLLSEASCLNPQTEIGADVVSRIEASLKGDREKLGLMIVKAVDGILCELARKADVLSSRIDRAVITGNTVMLSLLTKESVEPFSHAPFRAERLFGETLNAGDLGISSISPDASIYLPSCISAFVGADTVCAILFSGMLDEKSALLADIGTNGEMALYQDGRLTVASTAAGPAFEGVGISMGMRGGFGAIDRVFVEDKKLKAHTVGDTVPVGICGSGLVDVAACMLEVGIIDSDGYLDDTFTVEGSVSVTEGDIRQLQLAKSAISAGILTLFEERKRGKDFDGNFYVAGGFGNYLNVDNAIKIGLIPGRTAGHTKTVGNAALGGASMMLLDKELADKDKDVASVAELIELSGNPDFSERFILGMTFEEVE